MTGPSGCVGVVVKSLCSKGVVVRLRDLRVEVVQFRCPETMGVAKQGSEIAMRTCSVYRRLGFRVLGVGFSVWGYVALGKAPPHENLRQAKLQRPNGPESRPRANLWTTTQT